MPSAEPRIAWIAEDLDIEQPYYALGRFSAYVDDPEKRPAEYERIADVPLEEALAWARQRADHVLVRLCETEYFSAGTINPDPEQYEMLPEGLQVARRRMPGFEMMDNIEADPAVPWDIRLEPPPFVQRASFRQSVQSDPRVVPAPDDAPQASDSAIRVFVLTSTYAQALEIADDLLKRGVEQAQQQPFDGKFAMSYGVYPHAPNAPGLYG